jgi:hypothetical protein
MNSYINLILESEGAKERLQRSLQSASEQSAANFFDSRHRPEANRAQKHSGSSQAKRWTPQTRRLSSWAFLKLVQKLAQQVI